jgi:hypothetical protein
LVAGVAVGAFTGFDSPTPTILGMVPGSGLRAVTVRGPVMARYERPAHIRAGADVYVKAGRGAATVAEGMRRAATLARNLGDAEVADLWERQADIEEGRA